MAHGHICFKEVMSGRRSKTTAAIGNRGNAYTLQMEKMKRGEADGKEVLTTFREIVEMTTSQTVFRKAIHINDRYLSAARKHGLKRVLPWLR